MGTFCNVYALWVHVMWMWLLHVVGTIIWSHLIRWYHVWSDQIQYNHIPSDQIQSDPIWSDQMWSDCIYRSDQIRLGLTDQMWFTHSWSDQQIRSDKIRPDQILLIWSDAIGCSPAASNVMQGLTYVIETQQCKLWDFCLLGALPPPLPGQPLYQVHCIGCSYPALCFMPFSLNWINSCVISIVHMCGHGVCNW